MPESVAHRQIAAQIQAKFQEAVALRQAGQRARAQELCRDVLRIQPSHFDAMHLLGVMAFETGDLRRAVELMTAALEINPNHAATLNNLGMAFAALGQTEDALKNYDRAVALKPGFASAFNNRGNTLRALRRFEAALQSYDTAIALNPGYADAHSNRGSVLRDLNQMEAAVESCDKAIQLKGDVGEAYNNRGNALRDLNRYEAALESYDAAIKFMPDFAGAYGNRGNVLRDLNRHEAAVENYDKAIQLQADFPFLYGLRLHTRMQICDWQGIDTQVAELVGKVDRGEKCTPPWPTLALTDSLSVQRKAAEIWTSDKYPPNPELGNIAKRGRGAKIRIGYFSMDFRNHPVSALIAELIETHDRDKFEVYAFSFGTDTKDEMRKRLERAFDKFIDVRNRSDREIAELARRMGIDIAIDLAGHTAGSRAGIFAMRAAPIQVSYLGYIGTMSAGYIDYIIADKIVVPKGSRHLYAEKIAALPNCYQANDGKREIGDRVFTREELGLPPAGFVFCCFNNPYKITPDTFGGWMRILRRVEGSVLLLYTDNATAADNLKKEAAARGVDGDRLVFGTRLPVPEYLARFRAADLFLDTSLYNAGTTANDALWAGLPVLTRSGEAFASRMAASLLPALDLPELITLTQAEYEAMAVALATEPPRLNGIKQRLARNRNSALLFDTKVYASHIEEAYVQMVARHEADLPPDHIDIEGVNAPTRRPS